MDGPSTNTDVARYCAEQVRRFDHDRYLCALFVPGAVRPHVLALYAFNVEVARVRELVREPMMGQIRLQWWREEVDFTGEQGRNHPVAIALREAIRACDLSRPVLLRLLDAREHDLSDDPPANLEALEDYADATAATLIHLTLEILGVGDGSTRAAGRDIGIAWALTGLLRAVPFHARQRRLYLPRDLLDRTGTAPDRLFEGRAGRALMPIAREIAARARAHLNAARERRSEVPRQATPALLPAVLADLYLDRLARADFDLFAPTTRREASTHVLRLAWATLRGRY